MTPLERILNLLEDVRELSTGYQAKCPAHDDQHPSLSIGQGDDGRVLLQCHTGCSVEAVTEAISLRMRDLFPPSSRKSGGGNNRPPANGSNTRTVAGHQPGARNDDRSDDDSTDIADSNDRTAPPLGLTLEDYAQKKRLPIEWLRELGLTQIYVGGTPAVHMPYRDELGIAGAARFRLAMEGEHRFRWRTGSKLCLYGLWRLVEMRSSTWIVLVEGESDTQTLWHYRIGALGLPGASTWNEAWAPLLDGFEIIYVVIEPGKSGEAMLHWLKQSAIRDRVRLVRLAPYKDPSAMHIDHPLAFEERWQAALDAATPWVDEANAERSRQAQTFYAQAKKLLEAPNLLQQVAEAMRQRGFAGDVAPAKLTYVALTSRLLERPQNLAVVAPSAAGKNRAVDEALAFVPPEAVYVMKAGSPRALIYNAEDFSHRVVVVSEADSIPEDGPAATAIRTLAADNCMEYEVVEKNPKTGRFEARTIRKPGPTGLVTTSTKSLGEQLGTRLLEVPVSDDEAQTRAVMQAHARAVNPTTVSPPDLAPFLALQRWLALQGAPRPLVPFAHVLSDLMPAKAVRMRRDFRQLLTCIQTVALLHQCQRERSLDGATIATLEDYRQARELLAPIFESLAAEGLTPAIRQTVAQVKPGEEVSAAVLAQRLRLSKATVSYRVRRAIAGGWLVNHEPRQGHPAKLALGIPLPDASTVLPDPEVVQEAFERSNRTAPVDEALARGAKHDEPHENAEMFEDSKGNRGESDPPSPSPAPPRTPTALTPEHHPSDGEFEEVLL
jgi:hypothetical protein